MDRRILPISLLLCLSAPTATAISVDELRGRMAAGDAPTLIDIRPQARYARGHIQGAINIPTSILARKRLPPLGDVIVYGDGIDEAQVHRALTDLAAKPGIEPDLLEGGLAAWESAGSGGTTRARGMHREDVARTDYAGLERILADDPTAVLVDLRQLERRGSKGQLGHAHGARPAGGEVPGRRHRAGGFYAVEPIETLTDLGALFPGISIVEPAQGKRGEGPGRRALGGLDPQRLHVLIDSGNGLSERFARRLRARGNRRVLILTGGEHALRSAGASATEVQTRAIGGGS